MPLCRDIPWASPQVDPLLTSCPRLQAYTQPAAVFTHASAPGAPYQAPEPVWCNSAWAGVTGQRPLSECVNEVALAAFAEWLGSAESGSAFDLCVEASDGYPQSILQLAQTPLPKATVVTSVTSSRPPSLPLPAASSSPPLLTRTSHRSSDDSAEQDANVSSHHHPLKSPAFPQGRSRSSPLSLSLSGSARSPKPSPSSKFGAESTQIERPGSASDPSSAPRDPMAARTGLSPPEPPDDSKAATNGKHPRPRPEGSRHQPAGTKTKQEVPRPRNHAPEDNFKRQELDIAMAGSAAEYHRLVETTDWDNSLLGPYSEWSSALKSMMGICFASATQDSIWFRPLHSTDVDDTHLV